MSGKVVNKKIYIWKQIFTALIFLNSDFYKRMQIAAIILRLSIKTFFHREMKETEGKFKILSEARKSFLSDEINFYL